VCGARSAHSVEQKKKLRNFRQTVCGSMRLVHVNTGFLNKRALYWQMLVYIYISYYKLGNVCVCVCVSVCVCPAIRFQSSQRIFSKFGGKPSTGHDTFRWLYMLCVHATRAQCARINRVRMLHENNCRQRFIYCHCVLNSHVYSKRSNGFSPNLLGTYYYSQ
jgi:hypothetical protein